MNKGILKIALLSLVCAVMPASFTSCKDYDDDINSLQDQLDAVKVTVGQLQAKIDAGAVITSVNGTGEGIVVTLSDGKSYTITNGKDGAPGTTWTIGDDGFWYKDGVKTTYRAIGQDGKDGQNGQNGQDGQPGQPGQPGNDGQNGQDGQDGKDGQDGQDGANGCYYVPNPTTGCFDIYQDGKLVEETNISWRTSPDGGITAVYTGNRLILSGVTDAEGNPTTVELNLGAQVGSIAFVPSVMSSQVAYPTTDKPFYHIAEYLDDAKYDASHNYTFKKQGWDKSNNVHLFYRVNPTDAYVADNHSIGFINRVVTSRAAGDNEVLLNKVRSSYYDGNIDVVATVNPTCLSNGNGREDIAAARLTNGQDIYVSDYIGVESTPVEVAIVRTKTHIYTPREYAINSANKETSKFIQNTCGLTLDDDADLELVYTEGLDLNNEVALLCTTKNEFVTNLDFDAPRFTFALPAEYLSDDAQKTNQQWFADLKDGVLSVNKTNLGNSLTPAIGRTPVVRVDAWMNDNFGTERMVASAYIKVKIVREKTVAPEPKDDIIYELQDQEFAYSKLSGQYTLMPKMDWRDVNTHIYGAVNLTSEDFWKYYGGADHAYQVVISAVMNDGNKVLNPDDKDATVANPFAREIDGISAQVQLGDGATQTSLIQFGVNNKVKTDVTYKNVDNKGAKYTVTVTIKSNDVNVRGNIIVKQVFYVLNDYQPFEFNPLFYNDETQRVRTKGKAVGGEWVMQMEIAEVFKMKNGKSIFEYYSQVPNVKSDSEIAFDFRKAAHNGIEYDNSAHILYLSDPMSVDMKIAEMQYTVKLENDEDIIRPFDVEFDNPFKAGSANQLTLNANQIGEVTVNTATSVKVVDINNQTILSWGTNQLVLSSVAQSTYKLNSSMVSVSYKFDENESSYKAIKGQLAPGSKFEVNGNGVILFDNGGSSFVPTYTVHVVATVTFRDLSVIEVRIPVVIKGEK